LRGRTSRCNIIPMMAPPWPRWFVALLALLPLAPLPAELWVREDFTGYIGGDLNGMPVAPGTGLGGVLDVKNAGLSARVAPDDTITYRWGTNPAQQVEGPAVRAVSPYQKRYCACRSTACPPADRSAAAWSGYVSWSICRLSPESPHPENPGSALPSPGNRHGPPVSGI